MSAKWWRCVHGIQPAVQCSECVGAERELVETVHLRSRRLGDLFAPSEPQPSNEAWDALVEASLAKDNRIAELEAENAALTETLRTLFKSAAATPTVFRETSFDSVEFPANALKWSV